LTFIRWKKELLTCWWLEMYWGAMIFIQTLNQSHSFCCHLGDPTLKEMLRCSRVLWIGLLLFGFPPFCRCAARHPFVPFYHCFTISKVLFYSVYLIDECFYVLCLIIILVFVDIVHTLNLKSSILYLKRRHHNKIRNLMLLET
jgi:hypothetical protein